MAELSPGATLSHYRIISKIGAGGMGEVYRAQDTELDRFVALKFLSDDVSARQNRLKRFIQEAKAASALNHPNILTVHEIGRVDDTTFIATEFVDGVTLRQHMLLNRLKLTEILDITIQIASALVAAHAAGIVHRDIKPENIMVRTDGIVKVLDFGLAKLSDKQESFAGAEASTMALVQTEPGAILGTVAYMSPEQAAGREVDARSDIWSLGVVLYELIAAHTPFEGSSKSHIIVAIIDHEPTPITQFAPDVPQPLSWIIGEALTKDPEERCQTAKEMLGKLRRLKQAVDTGSLGSAELRQSVPPTSSLGPSDFTSRAMKEPTIGEAAKTTDRSDITVTHAISGAERLARNKKPLVAALVVLVGVIGVISFGAYKLLNQPKQFGPLRMQALTTGGKISGEDINGQLSISPDGKYVVCGANDFKQQVSLWIRQVSTNSLVRLVAPETGVYLSTTFSPDGEQIYFVAQTEKNGFVPTLYRIPVLGGTPTKVLDRISSAIGFSADGKQFAFVRKNEDEMALMIANSDGTGQPKTIAVRKPPDGFSTSGPSWSPDGKRLACGINNGDSSSVVEIPIDGGDAKPIGSEKWASVGRVIWLADGNGIIMTARPEFSSIGTQVWFLPYPNGEARRITNDLNGYGEVSLGVTADSNTIATIQQINTSGIWISGPNEDESRTRQVVKTNLPDSVAWTPEGKLVYAIRTGENWDIWTANSDGSEPRQLTSDAFIDQQPTVTSDGRYVVFLSNRSGTRSLWRMDADGNNLKQLTDGKYLDQWPVCSVDGRFVFFQSDRSGVATIWKVGIDGGPAVQVTTRHSELPAVSPDGKLIAYFFNDEQANNAPKVSLIPIDGGAPVKTIQLPETTLPLAFGMSDARSVAYLDGGAGALNIWSQSIDGGAPKQLTNFRSEFVNSFAFARDGKIAVYRFSATRDIVLIKDFK